MVILYRAPFYIHVDKCCSNFINLPFQARIQSSFHTCNPIRFTYLTKVVVSSTTTKKGEGRGPNITLLLSSGTWGGPCVLPAQLLAWCHSYYLWIWKFGKTLTIGKYHRHRPQLTRTANTPQFSPAPPARIVNISTFKAPSQIFILEIVQLTSLMDSGAGSGPLSPGTQANQSVEW